MSNPHESRHLDDFAAASAEIAVVVDFSASYCPLCRRLEPVLADLAARYRGAVAVVAVDTGEAPALAQRYGVRSVPTLLAFKGGEVVAQQVGFSTRRRVEELFASLAEGSERAESARTGRRSANQETRGGSPRSTDPR